MLFAFALAIFKVDRLLCHLHIATGLTSYLRLRLCAVAGLQFSFFVYSKYFPLLDFLILVG